MIILKHLTVERFRLLREVDLHFPQRGSILIQGPNESGKSALLESIYFALYGEPFSSGKRALDELISYGAVDAVVALTLLISVTELTVTRLIERGRGQRVTLRIRKLGMPEEGPITQVEEANKRIIAELEGIDGNTLRNSCLVEQKGLERLETISGAEREASIRKLLGLEKLLGLKERFSITPEDEQARKDATERLHLAEIQAHIPELSRRIEDIEIALDAIDVQEKLEEITQLEADIEEQEQALESIKEKRLVLKTRHGRVQQLKKADETLANLIQAYDDIAEARREQPELEKQIADLERREHEELPALEKRVSELSELTRSFGTLQRMSNDLLTAVDTIKDLEQKAQKYKELEEDVKGLEEQVAHAREQLERAQKALEELEERQREGRPKLEARLERMKKLAELLEALRQAEKQYMNRVSSRSLIGENSDRLNRVQKDLREAEQEYSPYETEAKQAEQDAEALEQRWRRQNARRHIEEWLRLKGMAQGLEEAERQLNQARMQQAQLNQVAMTAKSDAHKRMLLALAFGVVFFIALGVGIFEFLQNTPSIGLGAVGAAVVLLIVTIVSYRNYTKAHEEEQRADKQLLEATNRVSTMVVSREAAARIGGGNEALSRTEQEIRSLGLTPPASLDEAQQFLSQTPDQPDMLTEWQRQWQEKRAEAEAARNQANAKLQRVTELRKEQTRLEGLRRTEDWENIDDLLLQDQGKIDQLHQEISELAEQEGLPIASINARLQNSGSFEVYSSGEVAVVRTEEEQLGIPDLDTLVTSTLKATEQELAALDGKVNLRVEMANQVKIHQESLDVMLVRQRTLEERMAKYQNETPVQELERMRNQQTELRQALQSLQDSLRRRVKPLGVAFGQAAISAAETAARQELESLQITLGNKIVLQEKQEKYAVVLKERQELLADLYKQLAKLSNTLGSWIVPPNPFSEALIGLRNRCKQELEQANEPALVEELDALRRQEGASSAKIALCRQEIADAQEAIATMLVQRKRPQTKGYTLKELTAIWPILDEYTVQDRQRLEEELATLEEELERQEELEATMSAQLKVGSSPLDLEQARLRKEQQERAYLVKKYGMQLIDAVDDRLLHKVQSRTEHYMQQMLPLLTSSRYRDVHITTDTEEGSLSGGPFQVRVWDAAAGEYVYKSALSAGTADQLSLALRLAFAIASLPQELNAALGFMILDEPLSSFDHGRIRALVDVIVGNILAQHFEQILLVSQSNAFDPAMFPYHVSLDNGLIADSNLPTAEEDPSMLSEEDHTATVRVPAISTSGQKRTK